MDQRQPAPDARSIRQPGATARGSGPVPGPRPRPDLEARSRSRPDPNPLRLMIGLAGVASIAAFTTAMLPSVTPTATPPLGVPGDGTVQGTSLAASRSTALEPAQAAPPGSTIAVPRPTPTAAPLVVRPRIVVQTRQSGEP